MKNFYGMAAFDKVHKVKPQAWKNQHVMIWKTKGVPVGKNPTISTEVYTLLIPSIDICFFDVDDFKPFKVTQTGPSELVLESPCASYDFIFEEYEEDKDNEAYGSVQEELRDNKAKELDGKRKGPVIISRNKAEMKAFINQVNNLTTTDDSETPEYWTYCNKLLLKFKETLNDTLIYPDKCHGSVPYTFM